MDRLNEIIEAQRVLQLNFGYDFEKMTVAERVAYVKDTYVALIKELGELLDETTWKPWTTGEPDIEQNAAFGEGVDALHFLINLFLVLRPGASTQTIALDLYTGYFRKNKINHNRIADGYDGASSKCTGCGRALDDPTTIVHDPTWQTKNCLCGVPVPA